MKAYLNNKLGSIQIDPEVIAMYAGMTAVECFGIVGMAAVNMKDGLVRLLKKESLTHGINVAIRDNAVRIDFHVIVSYGVSIRAVAGNLIDSVKYQVEELTGMKVEKINIFVEGVRVKIKEEKPCGHEQFRRRGAEECVSGRSKMPGGQQRADQ